MHNHGRLLLACFAMLLLVQPLMASQEPAPLQPSRMSGLREYKVGPGDTLELSFLGIAPTDQAGMNREAPIQADGTIVMLYLGPVQVAGMTTLKISDLLVSMFEDKGYYAKGQLRAIVSVAAYRKQEVIVSGAVRSPGIKGLAGDQMFVSRALAEAGGPLPNAGQEIEIIHTDENGLTTVTKVTKRQLDASDDPGLQEGDRINVPIGEVFFVNGEVNSQGEKPWEPNMTVAIALGLAGGPTVKFSLGRSKIRRPVKDENGRVIKYEEIKNLKLETLILPDDTFIAGRKWM